MSGAGRLPAAIGADDRYALYDEIASGGMATVHYGRLRGPVGFSRTVAVKRMHTHLAKDPDFVAMFLDEAHLTGKIRHPNVVSTLDVVTADGELFVVMDYVHGESLALLLRRAREAGQAVSPRAAAGIVSGVLHGLHAAHEMRDEHGESLGVVHRDVSPQNILVGVDGIARVIDFGIAKAAKQIHVTQNGQLRGKLAYMAPERFHGQATRQSDVFATGVVLWEALTGGRLFRGEDDITSRRGGGARVAPPSALMADSSVLGVDADLLARLDDVTLRALEWDPEQRFGTAREMAVALEEAVSVASPVEIGAWVEALAGERLVARAERLLEIESSPGWRDGGADTAARAREDSISTTTTLGAPLEEKRPAGRRLRVWAFGAVLVVGLATAARASVRGAESTTLAAAAPPAEVDANVAAPPPTTEPSVTAASGVPGSSPPSPEAIAVPHASPGHPRARPSAPARRQCDPPYTIDDHGRKHFKEQCFP